MKIDTNNLNKAIRHGEVLMIPVTNIPEDAVEVYDGKEFVVGHSETGHHHIVTGSVTAFKGADTFLRVNSASILKHVKTFDVHETKDVSEGVYLVRGKNEYDLFADVIRKVRD